MRAVREHLVRTLFGLCLAAVAGLIGGCPKFSSTEVQQVKEVEPGTYSIGVSASSAEDKALSASIDKAHCMSAIHRYI
jgi:hypothetical protein